MMGDLVRLQMITSTEAFLTVTACVRAFSAVNQRVSFQGRRISKHFVTDAAGLVSSIRSACSLSFL
jgi:hypothetical protein